MPNIQIKGGREPGRNELCPCGSKLKYKHCHGDPLKRAIVERVMAETMVRLIMQEKFKKGMICEHGVDINEHCKQCKIGE